MCDNIRGYYGLCGHEGTVYIARCEWAIENNTACPPDKWVNLWDEEVNREEERCPACRNFLGYD